MKASLNKDIAWRRAQVREATRLAAKYAKDGDYLQAARWYVAADFHKSVRQALEAARDSIR